MYILFIFLFISYVPAIHVSPTANLELLVITVLTVTVSLLVVMQSAETGISSPSAL